MINTCNCHNHSLLIQQEQRIDPTRTTTLRAAFETQMDKRFNAFARLVIAAIVERDVFGLLQTNANLPGPRSFAFTQSSDKVGGFMEWLRQAEKDNILELTSFSQVGTSANAAWTNMYIKDSYGRGIARARYEMGKAGYPVPSIASTGGVLASMSTPLHVDRLGVLYTRTFNELKGITDAMDAQISRILTEGIMEGDNPRTLANKMNKLITGRGEDLGITDSIGRYIPAKRRAQTLARTEIIKAHHQATIQEYTNWAAEGVTVQAEWTTAGDGAVCERCALLQGTKYKLADAMSILPAHPNCRCIMLPTMPEAKSPNLKGNVGGKVEGTPLMSQARQSFQGCLLSQYKREVNPIAHCPHYTRKVHETTVDVLDKKTQQMVTRKKYTSEWFNEGKVITDEGLLKRINKLQIPPAWRNVVVAKDPAMKVQAVGLDAAGRWQYRYSVEHVGEQAAEKFTRVKEFSKDMPLIRSGITEGMKRGDVEAYLLRIEDQTAIRAGSMTDFHAKKKAYGLTTLQNEHITIEGRTIMFDFIAKEGIRQQYILEDPIIAEWLKIRKAATVPGQRLFADTSASKVNAYLKNLAGGKNYSIKDFRTYHGTRIVFDYLKPYANKILTDKQKKELIEQASKLASDFLHNSPKMAFKSYINPMVWDLIGGVP